MLWLRVQPLQSCGSAPKTKPPAKPQERQRAVRGLSKDSEVQPCRMPGGEGELGMMRSDTGTQSVHPFMWGSLQSANRGS